VVAGGDPVEDEVDLGLGERGLGGEAGDGDGGKDEMADELHGYSKCAASFSLATGTPAAHQR
jgi:hypothetical protein